LEQTILIVDAEPVVRSVVSKILEKAGFSVLQSGTVQQGLEVMKTSHVDLLLTNVNLPGMSGAEAMKVFRSAYPDLRVLMISGLPDTEVIQRWAGENHFQFFPKPFTAGTLVQKVHDVLQEKSREPGALKKAESGRPG
jgi:DNA-binding NtrC family response regulator